MIIIKTLVNLLEIKEKYNHFFAKMVKIVVDIEKEIIALDSELHADLEQLLLENDSDQKNLWGANIYFEGPIFIEFTSLINIRPAQGNKSMEVQNPEIRKKIEEITHRLIQK
ncbi:MAG: DUF5674 family protein [Patescibacteria group bacterium]